MGKQFSYEERDQLDSYKAKDYAQNYDTVTSGTSRDLETYKTSSYSQQDYGRALGERGNQASNGTLGQVSTAKINRKGEIIMSEEELQAQIEMYERLSQQHKGNNTS